MIILWFKCDGLEDWVRDLLTKTWDLISGLLTPNKTHFLLNTCALYKWDFSIMHGCTHSTQVSFLPPFIINWFGHPFKPLQPNILSLDFREDLHMEQRKRCWNEPSSGDLRLNIYFTKREFPGIFLNFIHCKFQYWIICGSVLYPCPHERLFYIICNIKYFQIFIAWDFEGKKRKMSW